MVHDCLDISLLTGEPSVASRAMFRILSMFRKISIWLRLDFSRNLLALLTALQPVGQNPTWRQSLWTADWCTGSHYLKAEGVGCCLQKSVTLTFIWQWLRPSGPPQTTLTMSRPAPSSAGHSNQKCLWPQWTTAGPGQDEVWVVLLLMQLDTVSNGTYRSFPFYVFWHRGPKHNASRPALCGLFAELQCTHVIVIKNYRFGSVHDNAILNLSVHL